MADASPDYPELTPRSPDGVTPELSSAPAESAASSVAGPALDGISGEEIERIVKEAEASGPGKGVRCGQVTEIRGEDVFVQFDGSSLGTIPIAEFPKDEPPAVGSRVHFIVERFDPSGGIMTLSKRKADQELRWMSVREGALVEGRVTAMNKGGLEVSINGLRAFLPSSQCDTHRMKDISTLLNEVVTVQVIEVNRAKGQIVVSRRHALIREREQKRQELLERLQEGQVCRGTVGNITDYGAFVDIGGVDGLLHIREMSWGHVEKPGDVVQTGQPIDVKILKVNRQNGKVSLSLKHALANPWDSIDQKYAVGAKVNVRVLRLADFGAFVEVEKGLEGLIPSTELCWHRRIRHPSEVLKEGQDIEVVILSIDKERQRLSLSLKQAAEDPWVRAAEKYPVDALVTGKVLRIADFGAFVELESGVEGLLHVSEMSTQRIKSPRDVVEEGKEVQVRILGIDTEKHRVSLSLKPAPAPKTEAERAAEAQKAARAEARKNKKPLRGGLSSHWDWAGAAKLKL